MKKLLFIIPAICFILGSCSDNTSSNKMNDSKCQVSNSSESSSDWAITTKVKTAIMSDTSISGSSRYVSVTTTNGVVMLSGTVSSKDDMRKIIRIAKNVDGVTSVDNQMNVSNP